MDVEELARAISAARQENETWAQGVGAFRRHGLRAINPYPADSAQHQLWQDGFEEARTSRIDRFDSD